MEKLFSAIRLIMAIIFALLLAYLLIATVSDNPGKDFRTLLLGPLSKKSSIFMVINKFIPFLFTGVAVCLLFSCGQISTACEGAFYFGAVAATVVAIIPGIPSIVHIPLCLLAGAAAGSIIVMLPTWLNVRYGVLTIVAALLVSNIFVFFGQYLITNPLRDPAAGFEASAPFAETAVMPPLFGVRRIHLGLLIGIAVVLIGWFILYRTPFGIEIRTVGSNQKFSTYSGINVAKVSVVTALLAGAFAGMGGTVEVLGNYPRFVYAGVTIHGWNGIVIAVLSKNNPKYAPIAALFLAYLSVAADSLNFGSNVPPEIINIIQPIIIMFVAAEQLLSGLEHKAIVKASRKMLENRKVEEQ